MYIFIYTQIPFYIFLGVLTVEFARKHRMFWALMSIACALITALSSIAIAHFIQANVSPETWVTIRDYMLIASCYISCAGALAAWKIRLSVANTETFATIEPPTEKKVVPSILETPPVPVVEYDILPEIPRDDTEQNQTDLQVLSLRALIEQEKIFLQAGIRIDEVALSLGTNRTYLAKMMKDVYGHTFAEYMNLCRMKSAEVDLLRRKDASIETIALANGFNSSNTFNKVFNQYHDCTPAVWRKQHSN